MKQPQFPLKKLITWALYALIPLALFHLYFYPLPLQQNQKQQQQQQQHHHHKVLSTKGISRNCNYTDGRWVQDHRPTIYNGTSCGTIKDGQNCMAHGRPDTGYLHWRWQPRQCKLPRFNPLTFLNLIRNKHIAFVGDSLARNQLESLLCLLSSASPAELVYKNGEDNKFRRWSFSEYQVNVSVFWSPFLIKGVEKGSDYGLKNHNKLFVDVADEKWASELHGFDVIVFSVGHWFLHPAIYYEGGEENENVLGCHHCREENAFNHTEIGFFDVFRKAVRTSLHEVVRKGLNDQLVVLTTFSPAHFEGEWDKAGACPKTEPYKEGEKGMEYMDMEMRKIEVDEVERAKKEIEEKMMMKKKKVKIEALDVTRIAWLRGDGHPGPYMHAFPFANGVPERVQNDCVHWCLPGPIDAWNEILLQMVKRWRDQTGKR
ncbi:protein ALTERED XYLOGLUCAN 4 [Dioscorea cayenensis subsp. rotundata]|uniref:Protein ALTERED XYLOGLUCAN 4 n=1 Tax=Dioscorea cayennensis subsp. rotundata TaxID=55577 RepID=A0AB40CZZ5_DIOCR|nr:protein ALTERED XYLOGLUCAN 4 [Dioscorea cayenensis subsp. rotundata]